MLYDLSPQPWRGPGGRGYAERGDEDIYDGDEEYPQYGHIVDLVRLADVLLVFDVVAAVHNETHAHGHLWYKEFMS